MRFLIDCDGPLTDGFFDKFCELLRKHGIYRARPEAITEWDIGKSFGAPAHVVADIYRELSWSGVARSFTPHVGALEFLNNLRSLGSVFAVTAPLDSPYWSFDRELWLVQQLGFKLTEVISAREKSFISGDVLLDDRVETLISWRQQNPSGLAILWDAPHNRRSDWVGAVAHNYGEVMQLLKK